MKRAQGFKIAATSLVLCSLLSAGLGSLFAPTASAAVVSASQFRPVNYTTEYKKVSVAKSVPLTITFSTSGAPKVTVTQPAPTQTPPKTPTTPSTPAPTPTTPSTPAPAPTTPPAGSVSADEQKAFNLLNADRAANGLAPLKLDSRLTLLGRKYAQDMINRKFFSHYNPEGQSPFDRMKAAGITYRAAAENIAINTSVEGAQKAFMNSSGHRANILSSNYTSVGVGVAYAADGRVYVAQEFIGN